MFILRILCLCKERGDIHTVLYQISLHGFSWALNEVGLYWGGGGVGYLTF
jgi:hypothetical protein